MDIAPRTVLRAFLLVGGLTFIGFGLLDSSMFHLGLGVLAAALGAFGLWWERRQRRPSTSEE